MPPTDSSVRAAVVEAARAGHLDAALARRALAALERPGDGSGADALRASGIPGAVVDWLVARAAGGRHGGASPAASELSTEVASKMGSTPGEAARARSSPVFLRTLLPGTRVGEFVVEGELGRGGMGVVLRARDAAGRPVALKMLLGLHARGLVRFEREVKALAALNHPNVVRFLGAGDEPSPWLAMELVAGEDLKVLLEREGRLTPEVSARLLAGVARGVAHAHALGFVHRDLKPSNVLVRPGGEAVVTDFGLARHLEASRFTQTGALLGTLSTMAPEQVRGEKAGPPADVWALGIMLFVCLTGRSPFDETDAALALSASIVTQRVPSLRSLDPSLPEDLDATCLACLERDPARRPTAAQVARALTARRAPASERHPPGRRREPVVVAVVAVAAVVALAGVAALGLLVASRPAAPTLDVSDLPPTETPPKEQVDAAPAAPWPAPTPPWSLAWSLAAGPAPEVPAPPLWDEPGRVASPLRATLEGRPGARAAALLGRARRLEAGRLSVAYGADALRTSVSEPGRYPAGEGAPYALLTPLDDPPGGASLRALNDSTASYSLIGAARWGQAALSMRLRRVARVDLDEVVLCVAMDRAERCQSLGFLGRRDMVWTDDASAPLGVFDEWRRVRFAPGAPAGARVLLDGALAPLLDAAATSTAPPGRVGLRLDEAHVAVADLEVEGRLLRPDRPALAWSPATLPARARVSAAYQREPGGDDIGGGPLVALGAPGAMTFTLELDGTRLQLARGPRARVVLEVPDDADAGHLSLERLPGDVVRGRLVTSGREFELELLEPLPLPTSPLRAGWGSGAGHVTFTHVEVHAGPDDPPRAELDDAAARGGQAAAARVLERGEGDVHTAWRRGALRLARINDPEWYDPDLMGPARLEDRRALAGEAADALESALARGLPEPGRADALARAVWARAAAADAAGAALAATRAVSALGLDGARARFDLLEQREDTAAGALLERFAAGYYGITDPQGRDAVLAAAEVLAPERLGEILARRASGTRRRGLDPRSPAGRAAFEEAGAMFERARRAGAAPRVVDGPYADLLMDQGRLEEALAQWERACEHESENWWVWLRRAQCLQGLERGHEALESALGALACAPGRRDVQQALLGLERHGARGLAAAALTSLAEVRSAPDRDSLRAAALEAARAAAADPGRDGDLARYVLARAGAPVEAPISARPTAVLTRARLGAADARDALAAAAREDALVAHLALLDPALTPLLGR